MAKIPEFHFDFDKVGGMDVTEAMVALFGQLEAHYNKHIKPAPILFGGKKLEAPQFPKTAVLEGFSPSLDGAAVNIVPEAPKPDMIDPDAIAAPKAEEPVGDVDTDTITPKTQAMKSFAIKDAKEYGIKTGGAMIKGVTEKGTEVFDKLLPGYDQPPYGPVVQGESGRYNLNPKGK